MTRVPARCFLLLTAVYVTVSACSSAPPTGGIQGTNPIDIHALTSSPTAEVTVDWSNITFTAEGAKLPSKKGHGCQDVKARRCGTWQLSPGAYTFRITAGPAATRTETSYSITVSPPQTIPLRLEAGHTYFVQDVRVYDATSKLCWYADGAGVAVKCR